MVMQDRQLFLDSMAMKAQRCAECGDARGTFAVARALSGRALGSTNAVYQLDGTLTDCPASRERRWQQHFSTVFNGPVVDKHSLREEASPSSQIPFTLDLGPAAVEAAFAQLGRNKGVGPDQIPAELLQAGEEAAAYQYSLINCRVLMSASWPTQWRGG